MKLSPTPLLWLPHTGRKYHRVGKASHNLYYSYCGLMVPNSFGTHLTDSLCADRFGSLGVLCKRCERAFDKP